MKNIRINFALMYCVLITILIIGCSSSKESTELQRETPAGVPPEERINEMIDELTGRLSLSPEQQNEIKKEYLIHFEEMKLISQVNQGNRQVLRDKFRESREKLVERVNVHLNEEQKEKYLDFLNEQRAKQMQRFRNRLNQRQN